MKKTIKKFLVKKLLKILINAFDGTFNYLIKPVIKELYRKIAKDDLKIKTEIIQVKKGNCRFNLVVFITPKNQTKIIIGRHTDYYTMLNV